MVTTVTGRADENIAGDVAYAQGNYTKAAISWEAAAAAGDASAMAGMAVLYDTGHGVAQDFERALTWYRRAAQAGSVSAMLSTGAMYDNGRGTEVDRVEAIHWYTLAAAQGNGRAAYNLGVIYRQGDGVPPSRDKAVQFFRQAAKHGIVAGFESLAALGARPSIGIGPRAAVVASKAGRQTPDTERFNQVALERFGSGTISTQTLRTVIPVLSQKARAGDRTAQYDLGYAYERGLGVAPDPVAAYVNYLKAAATPNVAVNIAALTGATVVGNRLTPEQHREAREALLSGP